MHSANGSTGKVLRESLKQCLWFLAVLTSCAVLASAQTVASPGTAAAPNEYIIKFQEGAFETVRQLAPQAAAYSDEVLKQAINTGLGVREQASVDGEVQLTKLIPGEQFDKSYAVRLLERGILEYAEPNYVVSAVKTPDDPQYGSLWGLDDRSGTDADIEAPQSWEITTGSSDQVVAVIDTGIDYAHPDLAGNIWTNSGEIAGNGIDDDGNGYVDDMHGWNSYSDNGEIMDDHSHGTHTAGTIGASGDNGIGVAGVNWRIKLMGIKFLGANGSGTTWGAIKAVDYMVEMKRRGVKIVASNNSWGGGAYSYALESAIARANEEGILFVAAAGNSAANNDAGAFYPANYAVPNVIAVAATTTDGVLAGFSNYGAATVHLAAPGAGIVSTVRNSGYAQYSGTSMAAPHVSGVAALVLAHKPVLSTLQLKEQLLATVRQFPGLSGKTITGGIVNAHWALTQTGPNLAPDLLRPPDASMSYRQDTLSVPLQASDPEGQPVSFSAELISDTAAQLDQQYNFTLYAYYDLWGYQEKWILTADGSFFALMPSGALYRYSPGALHFVSQLDISYYFDPDKLIHAGEGAAPAALSINDNVLIVNPRADFRGRIGIKVTASDGFKSDSETFLVSVENFAPELSTPVDQTMHWTQDGLQIELSAIDQDSDQLTYSASVQSLGSMTSALDQNYRFEEIDDCEYQDNAKGLGEKYFTGMIAGTPATFIILPNGEIRQWTGSLAASPLITKVPPDVYADVDLLLSPAGDTLSATASVSGSTLSINPADGQSGVLIVTVTASDGVSSDSASFYVNVANERVQLAPIADHELPTGQDAVSVPLSAADADGDPLTCRIETVDIRARAAELKEENGLVMNAAGWQPNLYGLNEKNLKGTSRLHTFTANYQYVLLPNGELRRWKGSLNASPLLERLPAAYWANPELLTQAVAPEPPFAVQASCSPEGIQISRASAGGGTVKATVTVSDGVSSAQQSFLVAVQ